jgi:hypothetical protein
MGIADHPAPTSKRVAELGAIDAATFRAEVATRSTPVLLRGQAAEWQAVREAKKGDRAIAEYLAGFGGGKPLKVLIGPPEIGGRFFYRDDMRGFNFQRQQVPLRNLMGELLKLAEQRVESPQAIYADAAAAPEHLPGWREANPFDLPPVDALPRLWIGNAMQVPAHFDASPNLAVCVAGRRRFTLFPPSQVKNLYIGPFEFTPAGTPASLVDPEAPDLDRFPRAAEAMAEARTAELGPGDAIYIPHMWWHHVRSLDDLSVLVNYWWDEAPEPQPGLAPINALIHALLTFEGIPAEQRAAWRAMFDHFVFHADGDPNTHIPEERRGIRGKLGADAKARLRRTLAQMLGR